MGVTRSISGASACHAATTAWPVPAVPASSSEVISIPPDAVTPSLTVIRVLLSPARSTRPRCLWIARRLRLAQEITESIVFFSALGWAGDRGALARASSSLAPISLSCLRLSPARTWGNHSFSSSSM
jgi:hypothetical protein